MHESLPGTVTGPVFSLHDLWTHHIPASAAPRAVYMRFADVEIFADVIECDFLCNMRIDVVFDNLGQVVCVGLAVIWGREDSLENLQHRHCESVVVNVVLYS